MMNAQPMITRYKEGYAVSKITSQVGKMVMQICLLAGGAVFIGGLIYFAGDHGMESFVGVLFAILGAGVALGGWWTGLLLSASGQLMKAQLDVAVNTSVMLDQSQKEAVITASLD